MKKSKRATLFFLIFMIGAFIFGYYYSDYKERKLNINKTKVKGLITNMDVVLRGRGLYVKYVFRIKGDFIENKRRIFVDYPHLKILAKYLIGKEYPVVYDTLDKSNNEILLFREEFVKNELGVPDSLRQIFYLLDSLRYDTR